jgi:hypothetical protein
MMTRFSKGTLDHDGDGRRGGSRKGDNAMAKKPAKKVQRMTPADETAEAKKTLPAKQEAAKDQFAEADAAAVGDGELKLRMAALGGY